MQGGQEHGVLEVLFKKYESQFLSAGNTRVVPRSSPLRKAFPEQTRLEVRQVELAAMLRAIDLANTGERTERRKQLEIRMQELDAAEAGSRSKLNEYEHRFKFLEHLASSIGEKDPLTIAGQLDGESEALSERRSEVEKASLRYLEVVEALRDGSTSSKSREEAGAALETSRALLRAAITDTVIGAMQSVMATTAAQSSLIAAVNKERESSAAELRALQTLEHDASSLDDDALRRELEDVNNKLNAFKG